MDFVPQIAQNFEEDVVYKLAPYFLAPIWTPSILKLHHSLQNKPKIKETSSQSCMEARVSC